MDITSRSKSVKRTSFTLDQSNNNFRLLNRTSVRECGEVLLAKSVQLARKRFALAEKDFIIRMETE